MYCLFLQSCGFNCSVGKKDDIKGGAIVKEEGAGIYNNIQLNSYGVKISKAYLLLENGDRVPDDNFVDFKSPVKIQLKINGGWVEQNGKVVLGASEKFTAENGTVVWKSRIFFEKYPDGI